ncbi:MAG: site-specific DNA-methyltransferase [Nanoarchaeota archaeon]
MEEIINKNHEGDIIEIMTKIPAGSVDLILTDPPYNASKGGVNLPDNKTGGAYYKVNEEWDKFDKYSDYLDFTKKWIKESNRVLSENGTILICCSHHNIGEVIIALKELDYKPLNIITWRKPNAMPNITKRMLTHSTEFIVWYAKGRNWTFNYDKMKKYNYGKQLRDVWDFPSCQGPERIKGKDGRAAHPTQKPLKLFRRLIEMASNENQVILDPFMGSGTTAVAAEDLGRKWIGIDNNSMYIQLANDRINRIKHQKRLN